MPEPPTGSPETQGTSNTSPRRETRISASRKADVVMRLLRGESLDAVSRELGLPVSRIAGWRDEFVQAGKAALKSRAPEAAALTEEQRRDMAAKIGEITMDNELLRAKIAQMEAGRPPAQRRSKR